MLMSKTHLLFSFWTLEANLEKKLAKDSAYAKLAWVVRQRTWQREMQNLGELGFSGGKLEGR